MPAWDNYRECLKDNPAEYYKAFCQMVYAMRYLRGEEEAFETGRYDEGNVAPWETRIKEILTTRQTDSRADWKALGEELSGEEIPDFDETHYVEEYRNAPKGKHYLTFLGKFIIAALAQKSMVTNQIYKSGNRLAGVSVDYNKKGFGGMKDFKRLVKHIEGK